jgi:hypothetical protein
LIEKPGKFADFSVEDLAGISALPDFRQEAYIK